MAGPGNMIPDAITASFGKPAEAANQSERVWPEGGLVGMPSTGYPDLATNPGLDNRILMHNVEVLARKHWWDKADKPFDPKGEGNGQGSSKPTYAPQFPSGGYDRLKSDVDDRPQAGANMNTSIGFDFSGYA